MGLLRLRTNAKVTPLQAGPVRPRLSPGRGPLSLDQGDHAHLADLSFPPNRRHPRPCSSVRFLALAMKRHLDHLLRQIGSFRNQRISFAISTASPRGDSAIALPMARAHLDAAPAVTMPFDSARIASPLRAHHDRSRRLPGRNPFAIAAVRPRWSATPS